MRGVEEGQIGKGHIPGSIIDFFLKVGITYIYYYYSLFILLNTYSVLGKVFYILTSFNVQNSVHMDTFLLTVHTRG